MIGVCHLIVEIMQSKGKKVTDILQTGQQRNIIRSEAYMDDTEKHHSRALL